MFLFRIATVSCVADGYMFGVEGIGVWDDRQAAVVHGLVHRVVVVVVMLWGRLKPYLEHFSIFHVINVVKYST